MLQLPPVKDEFPFASESWEMLDLKYFKLTRAYRFDNQSWVELLHRARVGALTKTDVAALQKRCHARYVSDEPGSLKRPIYLASKNREVDGINTKLLESIKTPSEIFTSTDCIERSSYFIEEDGGGKMLIPTVFDMEIESQFIVDHTLTIKVGAQVMLLANLDVERGLVNGSRGVITEINTKDANVPGVHVKFDNDVTEIITPFSFKVEVDDIMYVRVMLPLRLAWAVTIHKCQGLTLSQAEIDIGESIFSKGQSYVALSRCKSLEGTFIKSFDQFKMKPDPRALKFEREFEANATRLY